MLIPLLYVSQQCVAQQEDTLKLKMPTVKPELIIPDQPMQFKQSLMPSMLGIDGLEYTPPPTKAPKDTDTIVSNLSVENFIKFYYSGFLKWEKDNYGVNFDIQDFVSKNGKFVRRNPYFIPQPYLDEKATDAPYPLHPDFVSIRSGISIEWPPSKHEIWFKENFSWEKRAIQLMASQVDSFGNRSIYEVQNLQRVDSIIKQNKIDSSGQFNPVNINYKKRIKQLRKNIRENAKLNLE